MADARDNSLRSLLVAALAGGAGAYVVSRAVAQIWLGAGLALQQPMAVAQTVAMVVAATAFALWFGRTLNTQRAANWAAIGYVLVVFGPWLLSFLVYAALGGDAPFEFAGLGAGLPWPAILACVPVCAGFVLGHWVGAGAMNRGAKGHS